MRVSINPWSVKVWLSARDTYEWAHKAGASWPCSQLSNRRVFAEFDRGGLVDFTINGKSRDCDANELNAITSDALRGRLPKDHPAYFVAVAQFD